MTTEKLSIEDRLEALGRTLDDAADADAPPRTPAVASPRPRRAALLAAAAAAAVLCVGAAVALRDSGSPQPLEVGSGATDAPSTTEPTESTAPTDTTSVMDARVAVANGGARSGDATVLAEQLRAAGFADTAGAYNAGSSSVGAQTTVILSRTADDAVARDLLARLGLPEDAVGQTGSGTYLSDPTVQFDVVIVLGSDWTPRRLVDP